MIIIEFETEGWYDHLWYRLIIPGIVLSVILVALHYAIVLANYLHVSGKANEWVVLIGPDGKMKKCGVGLNCFRGLQDQVAKFPAKVNKVEFATQQVTTEMQGVQVSGAIIWTIYRE